MHFYNGYLVSFCYINLKYYINVIVEKIYIKRASFNILKNEACSFAVHLHF